MEVPTVVQVRSWAGLDVHAAKVVAAVVDGESGELSVRRLGGDADAVASFLAGFPGPVRATYEAGPTGFGLARALERAGVGCVVAAPGKIPVVPTDHIKTDRRDAEKLVRLLMAGGLSAVRVPTLGEEALRDLVRAREDVRLDLNRARHRLLKLCHGDGGCQVGVRGCRGWGLVARGGSGGGPRCGCATRGQAVMRGFG